MANVAENRTDQYDYRCGDLRSHPEYFYKKGQQNKAQNEAEKISAGKTEIFPEGIPSLL